MKKKKLAAVIAACTLAAIMFTGGAVAYLTDTDTATNTFTVGEVKIDTVEPNYPGNGSDQTVDLVPNQEVPKDPQIKNTGKNRAIVYSQIDIPMANVIIADSQGNRKPQANTELFLYRTTDGKFNSIHPEWVELETSYLDETGKATGADRAAKVRRLYGYSTVLDEDETTVPVFDVVKLENVIEQQVDNSTQNIVITSYAIQAENIADLTTADYDAKMDASQLGKIYQVYVCQSGDVAPDDADTSNDQTLVNSTLNVTMQVDETHLRLNTGDEGDARTVATVKVAYTGKGTAPAATFTSSNTGIVRVDDNGNITAVSVGDAVITATAKNPDTGKTASASVTIQVRDVNSGK